MNLDDRITRAANRYAKRMKRNRLRDRRASSEWQTRWARVVRKTRRQWHDRRGPMQRAMTSEAERTKALFDRWDGALRRMSDVR